MLISVGNSAIPYKLHKTLFEVNNFYQRCYAYGLHKVQEVPDQLNLLFPVSVLGGRPTNKEQI